MTARSFPPAARVRGVSFAEIIAMIGLLAVLAAISIHMIGGMVPSVKYSTAEANLQILNRAVLRFNQANWELVLETEPGTADEEAVFRSLQYRSGSDPAPGAPYLPPTLTGVGTDDTETYRASWNGRMFELIEPENNGAGLDLLRMVEGGSADFDDNFKPVGAR